MNKQTKESIMQLEPIALYSLMESHMVEGIMFHNDMSDYFNFIGLHGFKRIHEYQFYEENKNRRLLVRNVLDVHNVLIPHVEVETKEYIPRDWYKYTRMNIDDTIIPKLTRNAWKMYREWEEQTKEMYENIACAFMKKEMLMDYSTVMCYVKDVQGELKKIYRMCECLSNVAYDPVYIMEIQGKVHDKYKHKLNKLKLH